MTGRRRRIDGWGFEGEALEPSPELLEWLRARIGAGTPQPRGGFRRIVEEAPARLPSLPSRLSTRWPDRVARARGQGLPDLLRLRHGTPGRVADAVVWPTESEIPALLETCAEAGIRIVIRGGGTSVTGGLTVPGGPGPVVVVDLERLSGLTDLDVESGLATFGAGTLGPSLEAALAGRGLRLGHLPQSWELSSLGGWIVTRSSGQESFGVGRIEDLVAGLEVVAPGGRLRLAPQPASAAGPDLREIVLGSEGRLGIVTRASVRVREAAAGREVRAWMLPSFDAGSGAVRQLARAGIPLLTMRLSDAPETAVALRVGLGGGAKRRWVERYLRVRGIRDGCMLLLGAEGSGAELRSIFGRTGPVVRRRGGVSLGASPGRQWAADRFRHPYLRDSLLDRGIASDTLETACPWSGLSRLRSAIDEALRRAAASRDTRVEVLSHLSHVYRDGTSLYVTLFFPCAPSLEESLELWATLKRAATDAILAAGGTVSHHHGVGTWHAPWLPREVGEPGVEALRAAARSLDPDGILNPGVLLDPTDRLME